METRTDTILMIDQSANLDEFEELALPSKEMKANTDSF